MSRDPRLVVVTGMSGAGRSTCLKILEDLGFEALDNLPLPLMERLLRDGEAIEGDLAIGVDTRTRAFAPARLIALVEALRAASGYRAELVFFTCDDEVLQRRYTETRRRHPLASDRPVADGIARERTLLAPLQDAADRVVDTTTCAIPELRRRLDGLYGGGGRRLVVGLVSFAYRRGLPREADLVFDVRFLQNPHYIEGLRPLTGLDPDVQRHIAADPGFAPFVERLDALLLPLLKHYAAEGKSYLTIAFGCSGGRHRSVYLAELFAERLGAAGWDVGVHHRETGEAIALGAAP